MHGTNNPRGMSHLNTTGPLQCCTQNTENREEDAPLCVSHKREFGFLVQGRGGFHGGEIQTCLMSSEDFPVCSNQREHSNFEKPQESSFSLSYSSYLVQLCPTDLSHLQQQLVCQECSPDESCLSLNRRGWVCKTKTA